MSNTQRVVPESISAEVSIWPDRVIDKVNPLIFGQQIEFMGRGIDGGIWAELLRNRKFGIPDENDDGVSEEWIPMRRGNTVEFALDATNPYCPPHAQRVSVRELTDPNRCPGLRQDGVAAVGGCEYAGYVWLRGEDFGGSVEVGLGRGSRPLFVSSGIGSISGDWRRYDFRFTPPFDDPFTGFQILISGEGIVWVGPISLMPSDNESGFDKGVLNLLRAVRPPQMRWPGGAYADGYHFEQALGPRDKRPMTFDDVWYAWSPNDMGTDEFLTLCRLLETQPSITINTKTATAAEAARWVEYCNGAASTAYGKKRAGNGHPEAYDVEYWSIGNESYFHFDAETYMKQVNEFVPAIRKIDPDITVCAVGKNGDFDWDATVVNGAQGKFTWLSEHYYYPHPWVKEEGQEDKVTHDALFQPAFLESVLRDLRARLDKLPDGAAEEVEITLDEWNSWPASGKLPDVHRPGVEKDPEPALLPFINILDFNFRLREGLHACCMFNALIRLAGDVEAANVWSSCNQSGIVRTDGLNAFGTPVYHAFDLYRNHSGDQAVEVQTDCEEAEYQNYFEQGGNKAPYLDVAATTSAGGSRLFVHLVNRHQQQPADVQLNVGGDFSAASGTSYRLAGESWRARNDYLHPTDVSVVEEPLEIIEQDLNYTVPALTAITLELCSAVEDTK